MLFWEFYLMKVSELNFWKLRVLRQTPGAKRHRKPREDVNKPAEAAKTSRRRVHTALAPFLPVVVRPNSTRAEWWCEIACRNGRCLRLREAISEAELKALL